MQQGSDVKQAIINNRSNKELRCLLFEATYNTPGVVGRGEGCKVIQVQMQTLGYSHIINLFELCFQMSFTDSQNTYFLHAMHNLTAVGNAVVNHHRAPIPAENWIPGMNDANRSKFLQDIRRDRESDELSLSFSVQGVSRLKYPFW